MGTYCTLSCVRPEEVFWQWPCIVFALVVTAACGLSGDSVSLPDGEPGIGFDDLRWSASLHRVVAPGGRAGEVYLIAPDSKDVVAIGGFGARADYSGGHDDGPTSADEGRGFLFITDRTTRELVVVDPHATPPKILSRTSVAASPDYVRYVAATDELWVSEPAGGQIEIFARTASGSSGGGSDGSAPHAIGAIAIDNGPESLVIDAIRGIAYTHNWQAHTIGIDVHSRAIVGRWSNGCAASRGIDLEPEHGWVLAACNEGTVTVMDPAEGGRIIAAVQAGSGYDVMGYARSTRHIYVAGGACGCLTILGLSREGSLGVLGRFDAPSDTHCAVADDHGHAWVCAPSAGELRRVDDPFPSWAMR